MRVYQDYPHKYSNICLMENYYDLFLENEDTLSPRLGRHYQGVPNDRDDVHLGNAGIRLLARCIKHCVLKRKGSVMSFRQGGVYIAENGRNRRPSFSGQYQAALTQGLRHGRVNHD